MQEKKLKVHASFVKENNSLHCRLKINHVMEKRKMNFILASMDCMVANSKNL
jgi:hypothetical protein